MLVTDNAVQDNAWILKLQLSWRLLKPVVERVHSLLYFSTMLKYLNFRTFLQNQINNAKYNQPDIMLKYLIYTKDKMIPRVKFINKFAVYI